MLKVAIMNRTSVRKFAFSLSLVAASAAMPLRAGGASSSVAYSQQVAFLQSGKEAKTDRTPGKQVDWSAFLPSGDGQIQVASACSTCHDLKLVVADRRAGLEAWKGIVEDMVFSKGAPAQESDVPVMTEYLARFFGPATPKLELPIAINSAPKEILQLLPGFSEKEVSKLLEARKNGSIKDWSGLEAVIGKDKASAVRGIISFNDRSSSRLDAGRTIADRF